MSKSDALERAEAHIKALEEEMRDYRKATDAVAAEDDARIVALEQENARLVLSDKAQEKRIERLLTQMHSLAVKSRKLKQETAKTAALERQVTTLRGALENVKPVIERVIYREGRFGDSSSADHALAAINTALAVQLKECGWCGFVLDSCECCGIAPGEDYY